MAIVTSQQINDYFDTYRDVEVTHTKEVIKATGLMPKQIMLKSLGDFWPCVPYSSSMVAAKVIANLKAEFFETIRHANNLVALRLSFQLPDKIDPLSFFISSRVEGVNKYSEDHPDVYFLTLRFAQKPPDDFIEIFGRLLDANLNAAKRKEERIVVTPESLRGLGLRTKETAIALDNTPRKCIIRDISFSGAKVLLLGEGKEFQGMKARLALAFEDEENRFIIPGDIVRCDGVEGREEICVLAMHFDEAQVPIRYKMKINSYLTSTKLGVLKEDGQD